MTEGKKHEHHVHKEHHTKHKKTKSFVIKKSDAWKIATALAVLLLIISVVTGGFGIRKGRVAGTISAEEAAQKAMSYINANLLQPGISAELKGVNEENGIYSIDISVGGQDYTSYVTQDGKMLFVQGIDMTQKIEKADASTQPAQDIPKSDKPKVELFVMSFCPFGNRCEDTMLPVYNLLKDKVDWNIHYIVSVSGDTVGALHGQPEVDQNEREACILDEYGLDEWWTFATYINKNCGRDGSCWKDAAKQAKVDVKKIEYCVATKGLDLMKNDEEASNSAGASGSPTLVINGVKSKAVYQYENPEAYKQAICSAFKVPPKECEEKLASSSRTDSGGSC